MSSFAENCYKARYQKPEKHGGGGWKWVASVPWKNTFDEAQADLDQLAEKKGCQVWNG